MNLNDIDFSIFIIANLIMIGCPISYLFGVKQQKEMEERYFNWLKNNPGWKPSTKK